MPVTKQQMDGVYTQMLDKIVMNGGNIIDVYLNLLSFKWSYMITKALQK